MSAIGGPYECVVDLVDIEVIPCLRVCCGFSRYRSYTVSAIGGPYECVVDSVDIAVIPCLELVDYMSVL